MFGDLSRRRSGDDEAPTIDTRTTGDNPGGDGAIEYREGVLELIRAVHNYSKRPDVGTWKAHATKIFAGVPHRLAGANPQRFKLTITPDDANTARVFLTPGEFGNNPAAWRAPSFPLNAVGQPPIEFATTSEVWAICNADALVYVREELWAPVRSTT